MGLSKNIHIQDILANRPAAAAAYEGVLFIVEDSDPPYELQRCDGADWIPIAGGAGVTTPPAGGNVQNSFLLSGGQVIWETGYQFRVSAASYYIGGIRYESTEQTITLDAADATLDRIDVVAVNTSGTVVKITGTAGANPSEPSIDPGTQLKLAIVTVDAASTEPATVTNITVYAENAGDPTEWDWTASAGALVVNSTNNPHAGTTDIEGTAVAAGNYVQGEKGSGTIDPNAYLNLVLFIRSKATWNNGRGLLVSLRNAGVLVGTAVQIKRTGTFGFSSATTSTYQQVAIPITAFAVPAGTLINQVRIEDFGGSIGFYIDDITLQAGAVTPATGGITQEQADARYAQLANNLSDLTSASTARSNLGLGSLAVLTDVLPVVTADPGAPVNGTAWIFDDGGTPSNISLRVRKGGVTYDLPMGTLT